MAKPNMLVASPAAHFNVSSSIHPPHNAILGTHWGALNPPLHLQKQLSSDTSLSLLYRDTVSELSSEWSPQGLNSTDAVKNGLHSSTPRHACTDARPFGGTIHHAEAHCRRHRAPGWVCEDGNERKRSVTV